ncbi:MAG: ROK family protein [Chloroflexi bacterium]|nr:ROK family protein [Chloroflexota bacterium]
MKTYIGVDLGGTNIRAQRFTAEAASLGRFDVKTNAAEGPKPVLDRLVTAIARVMPADRNEVGGIGIGAPGPLDPKAGVVIKAANLPGWQNVPLRDVLQARFGVPVFLGNDANLGAMAEWKYGAARGHNDVIYLTISTGIGGGVISAGQVIGGVRGMGGELGHTIAVGADGPMCGCGQRGCLESVASGPAIARRAAERIREGVQSRIPALANGGLAGITAETVGRAAAEGDRLAREIVAETGNYLGRSIASFMHIFNPSIVVLGGGVSMIGDLLFDSIRVGAQKHAQSEAYWKNCPIVPAALGEEVVLLGGLALALEAGR